MTEPYRAEDLPENEKMNDLLDAVSGAFTAKIERIPASSDEPDVEFTCPDHGPWVTQLVLRGAPLEAPTWELIGGITRCPQCQKPGDPSTDVRRRLRAYGIKTAQPRRQTTAEIEHAIDVIAHEIHDGLYLPISKLAEPGSVRLHGFELDERSAIVRVTLEWDQAADAA